ncbi:hypothetical protein L873DRAFT_1787357 [Choiromyces venosus 120613-1]|uniref:Uncharacterized protein n=1 Tax=Choiromyces venosus 120613-1 TaxID=1336337 RepID=A0A3N4K049_9PEZI|nr:hypothetical protein L873DRAFT_1787357 [Choiromyces venosus 120613-1]
MLTLLPAFMLAGCEQITLDGEDENSAEHGTIHWHLCPQPSSSDALVVPAVVSFETEKNPDGTKLALLQCWEFTYAVPSVPSLETASLIPWGDPAESFQFDTKGAYHQPPHTPPAVSLIVFTSGEGTMTIPGTGQKWRGSGGDILIAADTDGSQEMDWKAGTRVVDFSFWGLDAIPSHKVVPAR